MRRLKSTFIAALALLPLGGCAAQHTGQPNAMWRQMARAYLVGVTYDQALIAARQENRRNLRRTLHRLEELDATDVSSSLQLDRAEDQVRQAVSLERRSMRLSHEHEALKRQLWAQAMQQYRAALRTSPQFPSKDPLLLNALGYHLADQGRNTDDYTLSVELTARAVAILGKIIEQNSDAGVTKRAWLEQIEQQQAITRDSLAWGLYKLDRFREAEAAQQQALKQAKSSGLQDNVALAELWWHQAQILHAQGLEDVANAALKEAQRLQPGEKRFTEFLR